MSFLDLYNKKKSDAVKLQQIQQEEQAKKKDEILIELNELKKKQEQIDTHLNELKLSVTTLQNSKLGSEYNNFILKHNHDVANIQNVLLDISERLTKLE